MPSHFGNQAHSEKGPSKQASDHIESKDAIELLRKGGMLDHPGIAVHVQRTLDTNDGSRLIQFLKSHPSIMARARNRVTKEEFENALSPYRPYPSEKEAKESLSGPLKLGFVNAFKSMFGIMWDTLCLPVLIAGRTGSGKSSLIKSMIYQIITTRLPFNVLIPDLKKEYRHLCTPGTNLKVLTSDRIMINPLQVPTWCTRITDYIVAFAKAFVSENYLVGTSENLLIELVDRLYRERGIYAGSRNYPTFRDLYNLIDGMLKGKNPPRFTDVLLWLQNRLLPYTLSGSFQCQIGIPFEIFQKENLVFEMDRGFTDRMYNFTIAIIAYLLYMYNKANDIGGSIKHWFVVDEARILFNANRNVMDFGESILTEILTKSRAYGISFQLASQESGSFNSAARSSSFLKIALPLNDAADLNFIRESFGLSEEQTEAVFELPPYGVAVVRYGGYPKPFLLEVPFFEIKQKVSDAELRSQMASFYTDLDRHIEICVEPAPTEAAPKPEAVATIPAASATVLFFLGTYPFTTISELKHAPGFKSPTQSDKALAWLTQNKYVRIEQHRVSKTKPSKFPVLLEKALAYLGMKGIPGKGSFEHSLYQHLVYERLRKDGYDAKIEGRLSGSNKRIDVLAAFPDRKRILAFEITLSFSNLTANIISDFNAGVSEVVIVCRTKEDMNKAEGIIAGAAFPEVINQQIRFETIDAYFS